MDPSLQWSQHCNRPIQSLASSEILTPHPLTPLASVYLPPLVRGEDTLAGLERGWGIKSSEDVRHCSVLYICKYFVVTWQEYLLSLPHSYAFISLSCQHIRRVGDESKTNESSLRVGFFQYSLSNYHGEN